MGHGEKLTLNGACHCGAVRFSVELPGGLQTARRCTCSICRMRGAVAVTAKRDGLRLLAGEDKLATYRFNTRVAEHHFCSVCGIYTHHRRRSNPDELGVNVACLENISPFDFPAVPVNDGTRHPSDHGNRTRVAGVLKFEAALTGTGPVDETDGTRYGCGQLCSEQKEGDRLS